MSLFTTESPPARAEASRGDALGWFRIDRVAHRILYAGRALALGPNEFALLDHFIENSDKLFSRRELIAALGKETDWIDERTVDVWIGRLRRALKRQRAGEPIRTVWMRGYVLDSPDQAYRAG
jgi:two-component system phosphate regulon response regulator PhoB